MPVQGLPDPEQHRHCVQCGKWFYPGEGSEIRIGAASGRDLAVNVVGAFLPVSMGIRSLRFVCSGCQRKRRRVRTAVFGSLGLLLAAAILAKVLGFL